MGKLDKIKSVFKKITSHKQTKKSDYVDPQSWPQGVYGKIVELTKALDNGQLSQTTDDSTYKHTDIIAGKEKNGNIFGKLVEYIEDPNTLPQKYTTYVLSENEDVMMGSESPIGITIRKLNPDNGNFDIIGKSASDNAVSSIFSTIKDYVDNNIEMFEQQPAQE